MTDASPPTDTPVPEVRSAPLPPPDGSPVTESAPAAEDSLVGYPGRMPRAGDLSNGWRIVTVLTWVGVVLAFATVWNVSVQLGLSTWWLGPRGQPQPRLVQLTPFFGPALMILATINQIRWLGWFGLLASTVLAAFGVVDIARIGLLGVVELLIALVAGAVSIASLTGTYRDAPSAHTAALG